MLSIGGKEFQLPRETFLRQEGDASCSLILTASDIDTSGATAATGSFFGESGSSNWLLGDQFLQHFYSIYDIENKKVGLVPSRD